jgi:toxin CcdB
LGEIELRVEIRGEDLTLVVSELSTMRGRELRRRVSSLLEQEFNIRRALDRLFTGF